MRPEERRSSGETMEQAPETPAQAGAFRSLCRALRSASLSNRVVRNVDDLPNHLRADIGLPPGWANGAIELRPRRPVF